MNSNIVQCTPEDVITAVLWRDIVSEWFTEFFSDRPGEEISENNVAQLLDRELEKAVLLQEVECLEHVLRVIAATLAIQPLHAFNKEELEYLLLNYSQPSRYPSGTTLGLTSYS